ncbi:hypothetical protein FI667_g7588, partial [Globisporangium splendens]
MHRSPLSRVFEKYLYFKRMDKDTIQRGSIKVSVVGADDPRFIVNSDNGTPRLDGMIGCFVVDVPYAYFQSDHEIQSKWVALVGNKNNSDSIQGYLLCVTFATAADLPTFGLQVVDRRLGSWRHQPKIHDPVEGKTTLDCK